MGKLSRRRFLQSMAAAGLLPLNACQIPVRGASKAHVVIVGGGFGGATLAKTLRLLDSEIKVTLIEPKARYITCPGSNWLFAGLTGLAQLTVDYQALQDRHGVNVVLDRVSAVERERRHVRLASGQIVAYDRLILAPGISFRWDAIEGYDKASAQAFPHAWQAGPQTLLLVKQLQAMPDGGVVLIAAPPNPYRCPPGPYERASMMAYWLKQYKPRSKVIILDPKRSFAKQALFEAAWAKHYGYGSDNSLIEWHSLADNPVVRLDKEHKTLITEFGDRFRGDVLNIIPPQSAASIAMDAGLTDASAWCPVKPLASLSLFDEFIHVIGDAANYAPIPKSAFAANSEAKACALAVVSLLNDKQLSEMHWLNTCYSLVTPRHGISVVGAYELNAKQELVSVTGAGGLSPMVSDAFAEQEANYTISAYRALRSNTFG